MHPTGMQSGFCCFWSPIWEQKENVHQLSKTLVQKCVSGDLTGHACPRLQHRMRQNMFLETSSRVKN